jgi:DNA invertase Pin-like site-specific DNA recombinase
MTDPGMPANRAIYSRPARIGYIRLDPDDTDISRQALLLDGIGGFERIHVEHDAHDAPRWEKRTRMMDALRPGDIVYTASSDRLCCGSRDLAAIAMRILSSGAELVLLEEGVDTRTPGGRAAMRLAGTLARAESQNASRSRSEGIRRARESGRRIGRPPVVVPPNFREICRDWAEGRITGREAAAAGGIRPTSFYTKAGELGYRAPPRKKKGSCDD